MKEGGGKKHQENRESAAVGMCITGRLSMMDNVVWGVQLVGPSTAAALLCIVDSC